MSSKMFGKTRCDSGIHRGRRSIMAHPSNEVLIYFFMISPRNRYDLPAADTHQQKRDASLFPERAEIPTPLQTSRFWIPASSQITGLPTGTGIAAPQMKLPSSEARRT